MNWQAGTTMRGVAEGACASVDDAATVKLPLPTSAVCVRVLGRGVLLAALVALAIGVVLMIGAILGAGSLSGRSSRLPYVRSGTSVAGRFGGFAGDGRQSMALTARGPVSGTLPANDPAYRVHVSAGGFRASSPGQHLWATFTSSGAEVRSGKLTVGLNLAAIGSGARLEPVGDVSPRAAANRVTYSYPGLSEWFVNGPAGIEQGFTVRRGVERAGRGPLTLAFATSANAVATLGAGGQAISFRGAGGASLRYDALRATDARGRLLKTWFQLSGGRILLHVDTVGARYPLWVDPTVVPQSPALSASGSTHFGRSVAVSQNGRVILVGAQNAAYVSTQTGSRGSGWSTAQPLPPPGGAGSTFGTSVALATSAGGVETALVGEPGNDKVWVYNRSGGSGSFALEMALSGQAGEDFGYSLALDVNDDTALIGAPSAASWSGRAYAYVSTDGGYWSRQEELHGSGGEGEFGWSVALSSDGDVALVGAPSEEPGPVEAELGAAWGFNRVGSSWSAGTMMPGPEWETCGRRCEGPSEEFGRSVALSGSGEAGLVGAPESGDAESQGWAYPVTFEGGSWNVVFDASHGERGCGDGYQEGYGASVALSSRTSRSLIGAPGRYRCFGTAYLEWEFRETEDLWHNLEEWGLGSEAEGEGFGDSVALSGNAGIAVVGAPGHNNGDGDVWVFENPVAFVPPTVTTQLATAPTKTSVTLNATVDPNGENVTGCKFEYGPVSGSYDASVPCSSLPGSGTSPVAVSASLTGLTPGTTYSAQLVVTSEGGTSYGYTIFSTLAQSGSGSSTATSGALSAAGTGGTGTLTVGQYASVPGEQPSFNSSNEFFDVYLGSGSTFTKATFEDCELNGGTELWWDGGSGWTKVTRQHYEPGSTPCISVEIEASGTSPTLAQMTGTVFGVAVPESAECVAGYFSSSGFEPCEPAPPGSYVATEGATQATACSAGTFTSASGSEACEPAAPGYFVASTGQASQSPCASGSYQPASGQTGCIEAGEGYFVSSTGSSTETQCPARTTTAGTGSTSESDCKPIAKATCSSNSGTLTLKPGLTSTAAVQTVKVKGTLSGCTGEPFTTVSYTATLTTAGSVSCSVLTGGGEGATGAAKFKWTPKTKSSTGTLGLALAETASDAVSGELASGTYSPLALSGSVSETFTGGSKCGLREGKKAAKAVKKGTVEGSALAFD